VSGADGALAGVPVGPRRLVFFGTPDDAVAALEALEAAGFDIALVVTRADKRRGRGAMLTPSPVKAAAARLGRPVSHRVDDALAVGADLGVVVAFGQIVKRPVLEVLPMVNVHFSLLPRWRGAAPVERALLAGEDITGVCLMQLEEGLDTGPVFGCRSVPIGPRVTAGELRAELAALGAELLVGQLRDGLRDPVPQQGEVTYAAKISADELAIDWSRPAVELDRLVRVGGAWTTFRHKRLKVVAAEPIASAAHDPGQLAGEPIAIAAHEPGQLAGVDVACGEGAVRLVVVQPEGRAPMSAEAWRNGARPAPGEALGR
jgi:methionyl-tRNA formyltransferase